MKKRRGSTSYSRLILDHVRIYLRSRGEQKPLSRQFAEVVRLARRYRYPPYQYVKHHLYLEASDDDPEDFIPPVLLRRFIRAVNPEVSRVNVFDKTRFAEIMIEAGLPAVPTLATISRDRTIRNREGQSLTFSQLRANLTDGRHETVFIKPVQGVNGAAVFKTVIDPRGGWTVNGVEVDEDRFFGRLFPNRKSEFDDYLVQPRIRQHPLLDEINPASVNTVRIDALVLDDTIATNGALLRTGSGEICTDNWSTGGLVTAIDLETGRLGATAKTKATYGSKVVDRHPRTGFRFGGTQIPFWFDVRRLVRAGAEVMRPLRYLGWDIAITESGPVVIEANHPSNVALMQEVMGGMRHAPLGREVLRARFGSRANRSIDHS